MKTLIVIPTPIGNLSDISPHIAKSLAECDVLLCESLSSAKILYQHLDLPLPKLIRYWQKTEQGVINALDKLPGQVIGLITDAGMPCISDPGYVLVKSWHDKSWPVRVVPGPCAAVVAMALSGIPSERFQCLGFLPPKSAARITHLQQLRESGMSAVIYESPRRVQALCKDIEEVFGSGHLVCVMRELSKHYETYYRGSVQEVIQQMDTSTIKGEFCVVIDRATPEPKWQKDALVLKQYLSCSDAATVCSQIHEASRSSVYRFLLSSD